MLIEFSVENFLSFKDMTTLSMVAAKSFKEHEESHVFKTGRNFNLLKSAVVYGNNASGKSNIIRAVQFMKSVVINSLGNALHDDSGRKFNFKKFALSSQSENDSAIFEIVFLLNGIIYRYGFEIDYDKVISEWLFHTTTREVLLFKRELQKVEINRASFKEGAGRENDLKESVLFLTLLATFNKPISGNLLSWFNNLKIINAKNDYGYKKYTIEKLKSDREFLEWASAFVRFLEITNLETTKHEAVPLNLKNLIAKSNDEEIVSVLSGLQKIQERQGKADKIITFHRKYDPDNILIDSVPFDLEEDESEGTKKLLYLLGPWYDTFRNGKVLIVDELDSRLHSKLTSKLIEFFNNNKNTTAQLVCAVHDTSVLNKEELRRDQIWFVEKNQFGASELISLGEFKTGKVRKNSAFSKNYLDGKYGAIPYFVFHPKLEDILYGEN